MIAFDDAGHMKGRRSLAGAGVTPKVCVRVCVCVCARARDPAGNPALLAGAPFRVRGRVCC